MTNSGKIIRRARLGTALAAAAIALGTAGFAAPAQAQSQAARPGETLTLSAGTGTLVRLSEPMSDVFVAKDTVADVQVRSATQLYIFGKTTGETTIYATSKSGRVVYAANVRVGTNIGSVTEMLHLAMPEANIQATPRFLRSSMRSKFSLRASSPASALSSRGQDRACQNRPHTTFRRPISKT